MKSLSQRIVVTGILLATLLFSATTWAQAGSVLRTGGESSGGGDANGIEAANSLHDALDSLDRVIPRLPLSADQIAQLKRIGASALILVVDDPLPVQVGAAVQDGLAFSTYESGKPVIRIQRSLWRGNSNTFLRESTMLHELLVLAGIESTGNYPISSQLQARLESQVELRLQFSCRDPKGTTVLMGGNESAELLLTKREMQSRYPVILQVGHDSMAFLLFRGPDSVTDYVMANGPTPKVLEAGARRSALAVDDLSLTLGVDGIHFAPEGFTDVVTIGRTEVACLIKVLEQNPHF